MENLPGVCYAHRPFHHSGAGGGWLVSSFHNCGHNLAKAVTERVFLVKNAEGDFVRPPLPELGAFNALQPWARQLVRLVKKLDWPMPIPMTIDEFLSAYSGHRRQRYQDAYTSVQIHDLDSRDAKVKVFVKAERTNFTFKDPVSRVISPRDPRYGVSLGVYLKPLEHRIFSALRVVGRSVTLSGGRRRDGDWYHAPVVYKGLNARQRGSALAYAWSLPSNPRAMMFDFNRFDQHVSQDALRFEHGIYVACYNGNEDLRRLLEMQLTNKGIAFLKDGTTLRFTVHGSRMSGDMNTSLGNVLIVCILFFQFLRDFGIRAEVANDGDDTVLVLEAADVPTVQENLEPFMVRHGFSLRVEGVVDRLEHITFCQFKPVCVNGEWTMIRDPLKTIECEASGSGKWHSERFQSLLWSSGVCGYHLNRGVPILQSFYRQMVNSAVGGEFDHSVLDSGFGRLALLEAGSVGNLCKLPDEIPIEPDTRVSYWQAFGVEPDEQILLENHLWSFEGPVDQGCAHKDRRWMLSELHPDSHVELLHTLVSHG